MNDNSLVKIIHFMWKDRINSKNREYPKKYQKYIDSWKKRCPEYEFRFWYNQDVDSLWKIFSNRLNIDSNKKLYQHYLNMRHIEQCDYARYLVLYMYGGLYVDLNTMCYKNVTPILYYNNQPRNLGFAFEPVEHGEKTGHGRIISNSFLYSIPKNSFWLHFMNYISTEYWPSKDAREFVMINTGPAALARFVSRYYSDMLNEIIIDTCLVQRLSSSYNVTKGCKGKEYYTSKFWKDSANWGYNKILDNKIVTTTCSTVKPFIIPFVFLLIILIMIFFVRE